MRSASHADNMNLEREEKEKEKASRHSSSRSQIQIGHTCRQRTLQSLPILGVSIPVRLRLKIPEKVRNLQAQPYATIRQAIPNSSSFPDNSRRRTKKPVEQRHLKSRRRASRRGTQAQFCIAKHLL
jgi:hypothetical protein